MSLIFNINIYSYIYPNYFHLKDKSISYEQNKTLTVTYILVIFYLIT